MRLTETALRAVQTTLPTLMRHSRSSCLMRGDACAGIPKHSPWNKLRRGRELNLRMPVLQTRA